MLNLCIRARKCLILQFANQPIHEQPCLPLGGFFSVGQAIEQLLAAKTAGNRTPRYVAALGQSLRQFSRGREQLDLHELSVPLIEKWLANYPRASTRAGWLNRISTLLSFCVRRGYLQKNPCDVIERIRIDRCPPQILTVAQSRALLAACPTVCKPYLVLAMFAGIRPEEVLRMDWSHVNLQTRTARVEGKTRRRRIVPLPEIAVTELVKHPLKSGAIAPSNSTVRRWKRAACKVIGLEHWPQDLLRHTAASYLLAWHQDAGKVATMLGNSAAILLTHYHEPVTAENCADFWRI